MILTSVPGARPPPPWPPPNSSLEAAEAAEVAHENAERLGEVDVMESAATAAAQSRLAVTIVRRALLRITQHVVRLGDLLEPLLGFFRAVVAVGMVRHRELAICLLDLVVGRRARDAEDFVKICHRCL